LAEKINLKELSKLTANAYLRAEHGRLER